MKKIIDFNPLVGTNRRFLLSIFWVLVIDLSFSAHFIDFIRYIVSICFMGLDWPVQIGLSLDSPYF